jgi:hypothetical protein
MAETFGIFVLCVAGLVCVVLPCLAWLAFMAWIFTEGS